MATVNKRKRKIGTRPEGTPEYRIEGYRIRYVDPRGRERSRSFPLGSKHGGTSEWGHTMHRRVSIAFGHRPISSLDHLEIQAWINQMTEEEFGPDSVEAPSASCTRRCASACGAGGSPTTRAWG